MMSPVIRGSSSTRAGRYPKTATFLPAGASALETLTGQPEAISVPVLRSVPPGLGFPTSKLALLCLAHQDLKRVWVRTLKRDSEDFPGGPVVRICTSTAGLVGSVPGEETKIPNAMQHSQKFFKVFFILKNK